MTVSSNDTDKVQYTGNGSTTAFAFNYGFYSASDLKVYKTNTVTGVSTLQTISTHYTLGAAPYTSGTTVTFVTAPSATERVTLLRLLDVAQSTQYIETDNFPASSHETGLDKLVKILKTFERRINGALKASDTASTSGLNYTLPTPVDGKALLFSGSTGDIVASTTTFEDVVTNAAASASAAATSASAAATSATASATSATASATSATTSTTQATASAASATLAQEWSSKAEDSAITGYPGNYSALHWARKAEDEKLAIIGTLSGDVFAPQAQTTSFAAVNGKYHVVDTSGGAVTATLASSPVTTQMPYFFIPNTNWNTNAFTIDPQAGIKIEGSTGTRTFTGKNGLVLIYVSASYGYRIEYIKSSVDTRGQNLLVPSTNPAPYLLVSKDLPATEDTTLSSYNSTTNFSLPAGVYEWDNFTINAGHTMTLSAGVTVFKVRGTFTKTGNIASTTGATQLTIGDGHISATAGAAGSNGTAGAAGLVAQNGGNSSAPTNGGTGALGGFTGSGGGGGGGNTVGVDGAAGALSNGYHGAGGGGGGHGGSAVSAPVAGNANGNGGAGGASTTGGSAGAGGTKGADATNSNHNLCGFILFANAATGNGNIDLAGGAGATGSAGTAGGPGGGGSTYGGGGGGGGGGGYGAPGGHGGFFVAAIRDVSGISSGTWSVNGGAGGTGGAGGNGGNGGAGGGGVSFSGGGGGAGAGSAGGIGGKPGFIYVEYETGSLAGVTMTAAVGAAGPGGAAGTKGFNGAGVTGTGGAPGSGGQATAGASAGAGLNYTYITNPKTLQRKEVFSVS